MLVSIIIIPLMVILMCSFVLTTPTPCIGIPGVGVFGERFTSRLRCYLIMSYQVVNMTVREIGILLELVIQVNQLESMIQILYGLLLVVTCLLIINSKLHIILSLLDSILNSYRTFTAKLLALIS